VIAYTKPRSPAAEAYRTLRTNIQFSSLDRRLRRLLLTSATADEGKSVTVANLAVTMAQAEAKVIVVDCDLRRPAQHTIFNLRNGVGLTSLFLAAGTGPGPRPAEVPLQQTAVPNLWILPSGPLPPNPAELLASPRMDEILVRLEERADVILLDSPPVVAVTDAAVLCAKVDGVLLVVGAGKVKRDVARKAKAQLEAVHANVLGLVVNDAPFDPRELGHYYDETTGAAPSST
jgi:non-specific protein-tyrosine kinase